MDTFFDGLTVVEIADRRNQYAGKLLSDGGARVIQIEPLTGSPGRASGPFVGDKPDPNTCIDYWYYNTGKLSLALDLSRPAAQDLVRALAAQADIFLESGPPGQAVAWGLDYATLAPLSGEKLIYASITDFGQDGPWRDYLANDVSHLAIGGQMGSTGYSDPEVTPIGGQGHQAWHIAGMLCLQAMCSALYERLESGRGQYIDCAIHDCCAICTEIAVPAWFYGGQVLLRQTGQHAAAQRGVDSTVQAADGRWVNTVATQLTPYLWANLIEWMREEGVAGDLDDPKYMDEEFRANAWRSGTEIRQGMIRLVAKLPAEELMRRAQSFGLTWSVVRAPEENYDEPHWNERGFFVPVEHPGLSKPVRYPASPYLSREAPLAPRRRAPDLGEHTDAVLTGDLGMAADVVAALRKSEAIR